MEQKTIVILDYGSQYSQLIARRVREANVLSHLISWQASEADVLALKPAGIILSGGPNSVYEENAPTLPRYVLDSGVPVLGICYGMQLLAQKFGGGIARSQRREYGPAQLVVDDVDNPLFKNWQANGRILDQQVWMSHGDKVDALPEQFVSIAHSENSPLAAARHIERDIFSVQFHPEVAHTTQGRIILENFVHEICGCPADWTPDNFIESQVASIREQVGNGRVVLGLSGGVDSAVAGALIHKAIGDQLTCIFVDHGMLRKNEATQVVQTFEKEQGMKLIAVNVVEEYLEALDGITDPEQKRRIIGEKFVRLFEREANKLGKIDFLAQGTIYPDVIESAGKDKKEAHVIKTHHNVGGLPDDMTFQLVEPLKMLFKDEVRQLGTALGLPDSIVWRQPFPGPGLAIRCLGKITWARLERLREADAIFVSELQAANMLRTGTQQSFAVLLPVKSVGVMGDGRTYQEVIALRAVTTDDFMTADWARLPYDLLAKVSRRIVNEVEGVNRVVLDITSKPPGTIEWE
ncbi:MAG: glutamine-hydrolyzing GMP synthase [Chloroflexota bacterium]